MSDFLTAAYNHELAAQSDSPASGNWLDSIASLPTTFAAGAIAAVTEIANIPTALASLPVNFLGGEMDGKWLRTEEVFGEMDNMLGTDMEGYYYKHREGADAIGFIGASLVPGLLATKAARVGLGSVAKLENTSGMARAIGRFETIGPRALETAKLEIAGGSPFSYMNSQAFKAYAAGAGQGVIDALAFNTAATLALHSSAYLEDKSFGELTKDLLFDSIILGAPIGAVFDVAGKGVGIFGYKKGIKSYAEKFSDVKRAAFAPFNMIGDIATQGSKLETGAGKLYTVSAGDEAMFRLKDVKDLDARKTELKALLDSGALSSDNANLLRTEMETFTRWRDEAMTTARAKVTESVQKLFGEVSDIVDVNAIAKQLLDPKKSLDDGASILAAATKGRRLNMDEINDITTFNSLKLFQKDAKDTMNFTMEEIAGGTSRMVKVKSPLRAADETEVLTKLGLDPAKKISNSDLEDALMGAGYDSVIVGKNVKLVRKFDKNGLALQPAPSRTALLDIIDGKVVNKASKATAWDLPKAEYKKMIADMLPEDADDVIDIAAFRSPVENSALYKRELDNFNMKRLKEASNLPSLDILVANASKNSTIRYLGKDLTVDEAANIVRNRKIELAEEMAKDGKNTEQISVALMIPEETLFDYNSAKGFTTVLDSSAQQPRYIAMSYNRTRNINKFEIEGKVEIAKKIQLAQAQMKAIVSSVNPELAAIPNVILDRYTEDFASGTFSYRDAKFGRLFEQSLDANSKIYSKISQTAVENRVMPIKTAIEQIKAAGIGSADHTEFVLMNSWNKQARNFAGGGHSIAVKTDGGFVLMQADNFAETKKRMVDEMIEAGVAADEIAALPGSAVLQRYLQSSGAAALKVGARGSVLPIKTDSVNSFLTSHFTADYKALNAKNKLRTLHGQAVIATEKSDGAFTLYDPSINLRNAQHVLVIKGDPLHQNPFYAGQTSVFAAKTVEDLRKAEAWAASQGLRTYTKGQTQEFYKLLDEYDASMTFQNNGIKDAMQTQGKLTSYVGAAESLEDTATRYLDWHLRDESSLYKNIIATKEYEVIGALKGIDLHERRLLNSHKGSPTKLSALLRGEATKITKAEGLMNTLFNTQNPGIVNAITKSVDDFGAGFFTSVRDFFDNIKSADLDLEKSPATQAMTRWLDNMGAEKLITEDIVKSLGVKNYNSPGYANFIRASNMALVMGQLRLDAINSLVNIIGMPIIGSSTVELAIRSTMKQLTAEGRLDDLANLKKVLYQKEGKLGYMPVTYVKMAKQSIGRAELKAKDNKVFKSMAQGDETLAQFFLRNNVTFNPADVAAMDLTEATITALKGGETRTSKVVDKIKGFFEVLTKPTDMVESRMQFVAADAALQIAEAANLNANQAMLLAHTMVSKLQGNFNASAKPQIFQGVTGSAIGLFQSYQARLVHRLSDVVTDGTKRMAVEATVLQTSIFGGRSLPFFDALNSSLIADSNSDNQDLYSTVYGSMDRNIANSLTYGVPSALLGLNLSSRGNATPRFPSTLTDIPAVNIWYSQLAQIRDVFKQASNGADISQLFNHAVQHNVFSRPAQQLAVMLSGYSTTSNNKLGIDLNDQKLHNENNWLPFNLANFMRISGAKPIDEAVMLDTVYRWNGYMLSDREKKTELGKAVSSQLLGNGELNPADVNDFMEKYMKAGGTSKGFGQFVRGQAANSEHMATDRLLKQLKNDEQSKQLQYMLGAPTEEQIPSVDQLIPTDNLEE
jgi:hypothetical protein